MDKIVKTNTSSIIGKESAAGGNPSPRGDGFPPAAGGRKKPVISPPDPEVSEKKPRRIFTAKYKLQFLKFLKKLIIAQNLDKSALCHAVKGFIHPALAHGVGKKNKGF